MAARLGKDKITARLVAAKATLDETDSTGRTAMDWAEAMRHPKIITQLKQAFGEAR